MFTSERGIEFSKTYFNHIYQQKPLSPKLRLIQIEILANHTTINNFKILSVPFHYP